MTKTQCLVLLTKRLVAAAKFLVATTKSLFVVPNFVAVTKPFFPWTGRVANFKLYLRTKGLFDDCRSRLALRTRMGFTACNKIPNICHNYRNIVIRTTGKRGNVYALHTFVKRFQAWVTCRGRCFAKHKRKEIKSTTSRYSKCSWKTPDPAYFKDHNLL